MLVWKDLAEALVNLPQELLTNHGFFINDQQFCRFPVCLYTLESKDEHECSSLTGTCKYDPWEYLRVCDLQVQVPVSHRSVQVAGHSLSEIHAGNLQVPADLQLRPSNLVENAYDLV